MLIDDKGRLFKKINLVDLLIILIVLAAGIFVFSKFGKAKIITPFVKQEPVAVTFIVEGIPNYAAEALQEGAGVIDKVTSAYLGKVTGIVTGPDMASFGTDQYGKVIRSPREGYCSLEVTVTGTGVFNAHGVVIGNTDYYIYRPTDIKVGDVILFTRIKDIKKE